MYGLAMIDVLSLSGHLSNIKGIYLHMIFDIQKKNFFHHLHFQMEIGIILRHKLGKNYPLFQTNWFDNLGYSAGILFHCNCNDKFGKTFFSLQLLMHNFSVQQFPLLKEEKNYFLTIVRPFPYGKEK